MWKLITEEGEILTTDTLDVLVKYAKACNVSSGSIYTDENVKIPSKMITPFNYSACDSKAYKPIQSEGSRISSRQPHGAVRRSQKVSVQCAQPAYNSHKACQSADCTVQIRFPELHIPHSDGKMTVGLEIQYVQSKER